MDDTSMLQANYREQRQAIATQIHRLVALGTLDTPAKRKEAQELIHTMQTGLRTLALIASDPQPVGNPLEEYFNSLDDTLDTPSFFRRSN